MARTRLIRHLLLLLSFPVVALAVAMVVTAFGRPLVLSIGLTVLLRARPASAGVAAVALAAEASSADAEGRPAPGAHSWEEGDALLVRHHRRKTAVDGGLELWEAQAVTV